MKITLILILILVFIPKLTFAIDFRTVSVQATVLSKSNCRFSAATATLSFGNIDISSSNDIVVTTNITIRCGGAAPLATFVITDDDGLYETGINQNRLRHSTDTTAFIPYSFTVNPFSATIPRNTNTSITLRGTILAQDYANAIAGLYQDTVTLSINP